MSARDTQVGGSHYNDRKIQPWDIVDEYKLSFYAGCSVKYILRNKGDLDKKIEDISKGIHCLEKERERLYELQAFRNNFTLDSELKVDACTMPLCNVDEQLGKAGVDMKESTGILRQAEIALGVEARGGSTAAERFLMDTYLDSVANIPIIVKFNEAPSPMHD